MKLIFKEVSEAQYPVLFEIYSTNIPIIGDCVYNHLDNEFYKVIERYFYYEINEVTFYTEKL